MYLVLKHLVVKKKTADEFQRYIHVLKKKQEGLTLFCLKSIGYYLRIPSQSNRIGNFSRICLLVRYSYNIFESLLTFSLFAIQCTSSLC